MSPSRTECTIWIVVLSLPLSSSLPFWCSVHRGLLTCKVLAWNELLELFIIGKGVTRLYSTNWNLIVLNKCQSLIGKSPWRTKYFLIYWQLLSDRQFLKLIYIIKYFSFCPFNIPLNLQPTRAPADLSVHVVKVYRAVLMIYTVRKERQQTVCTLHCLSLLHGFINWSCSWRMKQLIGCPLCCNKHEIHPPSLTVPPWLPPSYL